MTTTIDSKSARAAELTVIPPSTHEGVSSKLTIRHAQVCDCEFNTVLELTRGSDSTILIRTVSLVEFHQEMKWCILPVLQNQLGDEHVGENWDSIVHIWNSGALDNVPYSPLGGTNSDGLSCENLTEFLMTGKPSNPQGDLWLTLFERIQRIFS